MPIQIKKGDSVRYLKTKREVAIAIEAFRNSLGKTKAEFADFIDMSPENYTHLSNGSVYPSYKVVALIGSAGLDVRKLVDLTPEEREEVSSGKYKVKKCSYSDFDLNISHVIYDQFASNFSAPLPNFDVWANEVRRIREIDGKDETFILRTIDAIKSHEGSNGFRWRDVIRSTEKLRQHIRKGNVSPLLKTALNVAKKPAVGIQAKAGKYGGKL